MNTDNLLLLEELVDKEVRRLERNLEKNRLGKELRQDLGHATDIHDLTERTISAMLATAKDTLTKLEDWSN